MAMYLGSNKVEMGHSVSGGGGSSDFSTVTVTLVSTNADAVVDCYTTYYDETLSQNFLKGIIKKGNHWTNEWYHDGIANNTLEALIFEDALIFTVASGVNIAVTGDANVGEEGEYGTEITVTGDCTITIS